MRRNGMFSSSGNAAGVLKCEGASQWCAPSRAGERCSWRETPGALLLGLDGRGGLPYFAGRVVMIAPGFTGLTAAFGCLSFFFSLRRSLFPMIVHPFQRGGRGQMRPAWREF